MGKNGNGKVVEAVLDELQERTAEGFEKAQGALQSAQEAIKDADVADKVDRLLDFVEENATVIAAVLKRLAGEAAKEASGAAAAVAEVASNTMSAAGEALDTVGEEVVQPTVRYGKGLRHGIIIGALLALFFTPWPGRELRSRVGGFIQEASDIIEAMRAGAAETGGSV